MLRLALIALGVAALTLGGTDALAQKDKKDAIKEAKEAAKDKAKEAKDKNHDARDKDKSKGKSDDQHGKAGEDHGKGKDGEHGKDGQEHGKDAKDGDKLKVDGEGRGKAMTLDAENAKHARRLEKIAALEAKAKIVIKPELLEKIASLREKEARRHEKALARINGTKKDGAK